MIESPKMRGLRERLIRELVSKGINDAAVLKAMRTVPRHLFVEPTLAEQSYRDIALPIGEGQTISQPYTVAYQTILLVPQPGKKVLEIGTGSGYQCALLCALGMNVYSVERNPTLASAAQEILSQLGYKPNLACGDGTQGWQAAAPFDAILVTAGSPGIPHTLKQQLAIGGRLVIPVGQLSQQQMQVITRKSETEFSLQKADYFKFVPLIGQEGWKENL